jgi:hypothetical protein
MQDVVNILKKEFPSITEEQLAFGERCYLLGQQNIADFLDKQLVQKEDKIKAKQKDFYNKLIPFVATYGKEMVREFYSYWVEPNKSMTKIKWELEATWDFNLRLQRWASNNFHVVKKVTQQEPSNDRYK